MPHHMVPKKERKPKNNPGGSHYDGPKRKRNEPELVPKPGRDKESYRGARRNILHEVNGHKILVRKRNPEWTSFAEYQTVYKLEQPELVKQISNRGEVHYVTATDENFELEKAQRRAERAAAARDAIQKLFEDSRHPELQMSFQRKYRSTGSNPV